MKKNKKYMITIGAVGVLILMAICFVYMEVSVNTDTTWLWIENRVNSAIPGRIAIKGHTLSLVGRYVEITGLSLSSATGEQILSVDRVRAGISILPLFKRTLEI